MKKILLIDDDPLVAQLMGMLVEKFTGEPFVLEHSPDYAGGLARLLTGTYALCLLDYRLGTGDGLELLREAKAKGCTRRSASTATACWASACPAASKA